ncbi:tweety family protein [Streptomyces sp. NBC_01283]|uniref:hypothetical protein n=1 Tax=Streptomyces sp. NBC_01283 TaxID=2903812 RepID=UPI00352EE1DC|nr:tweety family protein [Streptomyces sp. NBC_01283]
MPAPPATATYPPRYEPDQALLGIALGTALTALVFFATTGGSPDAGLNRGAFIDVLWWIGSLLALLWALMFCLPKQANNRAE